FILPKLELESTGLLRSWSIECKSSGCIIHIIGSWDAGILD
ncbi:22915_t:CDS:2, partial [Racocetra persica]